VNVKEREKKRKIRKNTIFVRMVERMLYVIHNNAILLSAALMVQRQMMTIHDVRLKLK